MATLPPPFHRLVLVLGLTLALFLMAHPGRAAVSVLELPDGGDYEIYSLKGSEAGGKKGLLEETPRCALNEDGLVGFFVAETADRLAPHRMFFGAQIETIDLVSRRGTLYRGTDKGFVNTLALKVNYLGDWAEWSAMVPVHRWSLAAPLTYGRTATDNEGVGNMRLGWKATYLPDRSYYRFAYGAVANVTTGNPDTMLPAGSKNDDELKIFGCVTTKETDWAVANLELGTIVNSGGNDNRFIYRLGMSYEAAKQASLIGEFVGEIMGENDHDTLDMILGMRLSPTPLTVLELAWHHNLRTWREYGWEDKAQIGATIRW